MRYLLFILVIAFTARVGRAQAVASSAAADALGRRVSLHVHDVALRDALDRIAATANIRLSYSGDVLPLDRRITLERDNVTVGVMLDEVLRGLNVGAVAVGENHVVLVPRPAGDSVREPLRAAPVLERVVVTGSVIGAPERALAVALDVVPGRAAERRDESSLSTVLTSSVPGIWMFEQSPTTLSARYGSIRGASSFSVSYPKVYIDGIEVANPLLLTQVEPSQVERVEIIRGPQGAALYGADAISGVVNIVSRHENASSGARALAQTRMGWIGSDYADVTPVQEHALGVRLGTNLRSAGISGSYATTGRYIPNAYSREGRVVGDARIVGSASTVSLTARVMAKRSGVPINPLLPALQDDRTTADDEPQALAMYAFGGTYRRMTSEHVTWSFTGGMDGYRLDNISIESTPVPSAADSALRAASGGADRATLRANVVRQLGDSEGVAGALTFAVEQGILRDRTEPVAPILFGSGPSAYVPSRWSRNLGLAQQANVSFARTVYLTAGNRFELLMTAGAPANWEALPMLGASLVRDVGPFTAKARASFGRGVRATTPFVTMRDPRRLRANLALEPEEQIGVDGGIDLFYRGWASVHVTGFDQTASGLVQLITLIDTNSSGPSREKIHYMRQNVGEITNRGWEGKLAVRAGPLDLGAAGTFVDSRVRRVAHAYQGDLRPGDRVLGVPERTGSVTAGLRKRAWSTSWTVTRATDWVDYDRLAIARRIEELDDSGADVDEDDFTGLKLRQFWVRYSGATRLRGTFSLDLPRGLGLALTGDNLTGAQRNEPDTMTILPGRTLTASIRARF